MTLAELLRKAGVEGRVEGGTEAVIADITQDSREVRAGSLFVALRGAKDDGGRHAGEAWKRGAAAIVGEGDPGAGPGARVQVADARQALSALAAAFHGYPTDGLRMIGVTGTNGKTTTAFLLEAVLKAAGHAPGVVGTVTYRLGSVRWPARHTTPQAHELQRVLASMRAKGGTHVAMEVSSHALALDRVRDCEFDVAVFTNLTQDHLDFHGTLEAYGRAKRRLFESLRSGARLMKAANRKYGVVNLDDPAGAGMGSAAGASAPLAELGGPGSAGGAPVIAYGQGPEAAAWSGPRVLAREVRAHAGGLEFVVEAHDLPWTGGALRLPLRGRHNVSNALAALAVAAGEGVPFDTAARGLSGVRGVPGRFEWIEAGQAFAVVVDYAHTPDALQKTLETARALQPARILTVFGCGGDRDAGKRPVMGALAAGASDWVFLTSDNPRTESPAKILADIEGGVRRVPNARYAVIPDREEAIRRALSEARPGDLVLIAGKGHETYQIVGDTIHPFDDREVARRLLAGGAS